MTIRQKFNILKEFDLSNSTVSLAIIKEYKRQRVSNYNVKYVKIDDNLENRLRNILLRKIEQSNSIEEYSFDCPEPEAGQIRAINSDETDFKKIAEILSDLNPEENVIESIDELIQAKSYIIILRIDTEIKVIGFKKLPENWKMKKNKGLIPLLFKENRFEDLEEDNVFSISGTIDFLFFDDLLFILSKKAFETGMNFREGMISKANDFYEEVQEMNLFVNLDKLSEKVGNNQRYLRKIATIKNLGYYKDQVFLRRFKEINRVKNWGVNFDGEQIIITDDKLDAILTVLQNKRLHSELTEEDFDVESVKALDEFI